jgi:glutathione S-transferase
VAVCAGITRQGVRCTVRVEPGQTYCHHHDPSRSEERRRAASRAGKSKPSRELADVKRQLQDLADRVLRGTLERADAAVVGQILNVLLRAIEVERKTKEQEELLERIEQLEGKNSARKERWRA